MWRVVTRGKMLVGVEGVLVSTLGGARAPRPGNVCVCTFALHLCVCTSGAFSRDFSRDLSRDLSFEADWGSPSSSVEASPLSLRDWVISISSPSSSRCALGWCTVCVVRVVRAVAPSPAHLLLRRQLVELSLLANGKQLFVRALLDDPPLLDQRDLVGPHYRGDTVCDRDRCEAARLHDLVQRRLQKHG